MPLRWQSRQMSNDAVAGERSLAGQYRPFGERCRKLLLMTPLWDMPKQVTLLESA